MNNTLLSALQFHKQSIPQTRVDGYIHQGFFKREESDREKNPGEQPKKPMIEQMIRQGLSNQEIAEQLKVKKNYIRGIRFGLNGPQGNYLVRKVVQLSMDGQYIATHDNQVDAALSIGKRDSCGIGKACNCAQGRKSAHGYKWMFLEDYEKGKLVK
jgi:hypothetical protein